MVKKTESKYVILKNIFSEVIFLDYFNLKLTVNLTVSNYVVAINRGEIKDTEMEQIMDTLVDSLFSVFATLGS